MDGTISRRRLCQIIGLSSLSLGVTKPLFAAGPIRVGFPVPLTGPFAAEAADQVRAARLAIAQFNDNGGLGGRPAELLVRDDRLDPGEGAGRALELIERDKVHCLVGSLSAAVQLAVNAVARRRGVLYVSISQSDAINEASDFAPTTFHEALNPHMTAAAVGNHAFAAGQRIVILQADYAYGHEMARGFRKVAARVGAEIVGDIRHPLGTGDFSPFIPRIMALRPDILCICNFGRDQLNAIKQANDFGLKARSRFVVPVLLYTQCKAGGPEVFADVIGGCNYHWTLEDTLPSARAFNQAWRSRYDGTVPTDYAAYAYGGVRLVLEAMRQAGSTETPKVATALRGMRYDFYKGNQYFRACDQQSVQSVMIVRAKNRAEMTSQQDIFATEAVIDGDESRLRSCAELGHEL